MLFERTALSQTPDELIRLVPVALRAQGDVTPLLLLKDPYAGLPNLDDRYLEKGPEDAVLRENSSAADVNRDPGANPKR
jgi:hypothetical protein